MSGKGSGSGQSPCGLRILHATAFSAFAALGLVGAWPELVHLARSQRHALHAGDPPSALALLGVFAIAVGLAVIFAALPRGRSAPLWASLVVLAGLVLSIVSLEQRIPEGRNAPAANVAMIEAAKSVHGQFRTRLQREAGVPTSIEPWREAFAARPSPVRARTYGSVPYKVHRVVAPGAVPEVLVPGTFLLFVSGDGASFQIVPVGFSEDGGAWILRDREGQTVSFSAVYNPDVGALLEP